MRLLILVAGLSLVAGGEPAHARDARTVFGPWAGDMTQHDPAGPRTYPVSMELLQGGGTTTYHSLKCGGRLTRIDSTKDGYTIYRETITHGGVRQGVAKGCIDGIITVVRSGQRLALGWFAADGDQTEIGRAHV